VILLRELLADHYSLFTMNTFYTGLVMLIP